MRRFVYSLMTDGLTAPVFIPLKFILYTASFVYGFALILRKILYNIKVFRAEKAPVKIVSVGNITLGGTGKTPFTIMLSKMVKEELKRDPAVLIRGYGWDEQAMLKKNLPDTPILVGEDRLKSADRAVKLYGTSVAILDDGFQHWELQRDLNIVLIDSTNPFGNGHLLPRGILREPKGALRRADLVVFTKADKNPSVIDSLKKEIAAVKSDIGFMEAVHKPVRFYEARSRKDLGLASVQGKRVLLVSSIADPDGFKKTVESLGAEAAGHLIFPDHHNYREKDRNNIVTSAGQCKADLIVITDKDAVKFARMSFSFAQFSVLTLMIELEITKGKERLVAGLHSLLRG